MRCLFPTTAITQWRVAEVSKISEFGAVRRDADLVELEKCLNAPTLAIVAVHTQENEPSKVLKRNTVLKIHYLQPRRINLEVEK